MPLVDGDPSIFASNLEGRTRVPRSLQVDVTLGVKADTLEETILIDMSLVRERYITGGS